MMKNNGLVFLGFLIICLVNVSTKSGDSHLAVPAAIPLVHPKVVKHAAPVSEMKMADEPVNASSTLSYPGKG